MLSFSDQRIPFEWIPVLPSGEWIAWIDIWIARYPEDYGVYSHGRHKPGIHLYWVEAGRRVAPDVYLNYYLQRIYPPLGCRPQGIYCDSPERVSLRGEAFVGSLAHSDEVGAIVSRIEPMILRIEAKIDALP